MILVEIHSENPLMNDDRTLVFAFGKAVKQGNLTRENKMPLCRVRYSNDLAVYQIPTHGIFRPVFPDWYYDAYVMDHLRRIKEKVWGRRLSTDTMKMFYDVVLKRFKQMNLRDMTDTEKHVWSFYGKEMSLHKSNCEWVEQVLQEGCISCSLVTV